MENTWREKRDIYLKHLQPSEALMAIMRLFQISKQHNKLIYKNTFSLVLIVLTKFIEKKSTRHDGKNTLWIRLLFYKNCKYKK